MKSKQKAVPKNAVFLVYCCTVAASVGVVDSAGVVFSKPAFSSCPVRVVLRMSVVNGGGGPVVESKRFGTERRGRRFESVIFCDGLLMICGVD